MRAQAAREKAACALALALLGLFHLLLQLADLLLGLLNGLLQHQGALGQPVDRIGRVAQSTAQLGIGLRVLGLALGQRQPGAQVLQQLLFLRGHGAFL